MRSHCLRIIAILVIVALFAASTGFSIPGHSTQSNPPYLNPVTVDLIGGRFNAVAVEGELAFIGQGQALTIFDIQDPASPERISSTPVPWSVSSVEVKAGWAFLTAGGEFFILDVSRPQAPQIVGSYNAGSAATQVRVIGETAFLPANGLHILDVSDPANPALLSSYTTTLNTEDVFVLDGIAYLLNDEKLEILDVQDPYHPQLLSEYPWSGVPDRIWVADGYAYIAFSSRGLHIIDVRDPMNPVFAGSFGDTGDFATSLNVREVQISGEIAYLGAFIQGAEQGLFVLEISNPAAPEQIGLLAGISISDLFVHGQWLYLAGVIYSSDPNAHVDHRFSVVNVSDPANPVVNGVFHSPFGFAWALAIDGDELYIADNSGEMITFDASNPGNLRLLGGYRPAYSGLPRLLKIIDKRAYFSEQGNIHILDIRDPANPAPLGLFTYYSDHFLDVDRHLAYFAHTEGFYYEDQDGFLEIFDLNDPTNPARRGSLKYQNAIGKIDVSGDLAVVGSERLWSNLAEALIIDVSNPDGPVLKGSHQIEYRSFSDIEVVDRRVYLVTTRAGLLILDATDLENPVLIGTYPEGDYLPSETPELLIDEITAYMITSNQILILDIQDPAGVRLLGTIPNQSYKIEALQVKDHFLYASMVHGNLQIIDLLGYREFLPLLQN